MSNNQGALRFSVNAWSKLQFMRDCGDTEIGGWGLTLLSDPLLVVDFMTVPQTCTSVTVELDMTTEYDFVSDMYENRGLQPCQCQRLWIHTHPEMSAQPSGVDEQQFRDYLNQQSIDYMIFFILSKTDDTYCRVEYNRPPVAVKIPHLVDFSLHYTAADHKAWQEEYDKHVTAETLFIPAGSTGWANNHWKPKDDVMNWEHAVSWEEYENGDKQYEVGDEEDVIQLCKTHGCTPEIAKSYELETKEDFTEAKNMNWI